MRQILIDRARRKRALRHGGGQDRVDVAELDLPFPNDNDDQLLAVNEALDGLAAQHPLETEVVKLRYFVGMTNEETAEALGISPRTPNTTGPMPGPGCMTQSPTPQRSKSCTGVQSLFSVGFAA